MTDTMDLVKMDFRRILILLIFIICIIKNSNATGQASDLLIVKSDTFYLFSNPLEPYLEFKNNRILDGIELTSTSTACWRGYIATWKIENDSLFLIKVIREPEFGKFIELNLVNEFGSNKVFAEWFTGTLYSPRGDMLQYVHMGYSSIYEREEYYKSWNGIIKSTVSINNLVYNKVLLYPAERFLQDTITNIIISRLDSELMKEVPDSSGCFLYLQFNEIGKIEKMRIGMPKDDISLFGKSILKIAKEELENLPALMRVIHKYYRPPSLQLWFHAYCIKNPMDKEYGCSD